MEKTDAQGDYNDNLVHDQGCTPSKYDFGLVHVFHCHSLARERAYRNEGQWDNINNTILKLRQKPLPSLPQVPSNSCYVTFTEQVCYPEASKAEDKKKCEGICLSLPTLFQKYAIHSCLPPKLEAEWFSRWESYYWDF